MTNIQDLKIELIVQKDQIKTQNDKLTSLNEQIEDLIVDNADIWSNVMTIKKLLQESLGKHDLAKLTEKERVRMDKVAEEKRKVRMMFKDD